MPTSSLLEHKDTQEKLLLMETIKINLIRSFTTGIVIVLIYVIASANNQITLIQLLVMPFMMPVLTLTFFLISYPLRLFNLEGVGNIMVLLTTMLGDPILYVLYKIKPNLCPIQSFNVLNFTGLILVYKLTDLSENNIYK